VVTYCILVMLYIICSRL